MISVTATQPPRSAAEPSPTRVRGGPDSPRGSGSDERAGELAWVERPQVVEPLPHADELDREPELVGDRDRDAALCRAVELRQRDARHARRVAEETRLLQAVLACRRVD